MRAAFAFVVVVVGVFAAACPDPCAFGGCYATSDCAADQVCRKTRDGELDLCPVVPGTCIAKVQAGFERCGSVDDCGGIDCCDPVTNVCVAPGRYPGPICDAVTCNDCELAQQHRPCDDDVNCRSTETCNEGLCAARCDDDADCGDGRCNGDSCSFPLGTLCETGLSVATPERDCGAFNECIDVDAGGRSVLPFCSDFCTQESECPSDMSCADNKCRP